MRDAIGSVQSILVLGGGSEIARATCRALVARRAAQVVLAGRTTEALETAADELRRAGASEVHTVAFDAMAFSTHERFVEDVFDRFGDIDLVLVAVGVLGDQERAAHDAAVAVEVVETNFTGVVSVTIPVVRRLDRQGHGTIVLLSSVAGERARKSNFVYGASKAGADAFFQGLGDALAGRGVHVMVVRPGFVHTKMTHGLKAAPFAVGPEQVADGIVRGLARGAEVVWVPRALRVVMAGLRHLPRAVFRRLPL